jgi:hypothetical protein
MNLKKKTLVFNALIFTSILLVTACSTTINTSTPVPDLQLLRGSTATPIAVVPETKDELNQLVIDTFGLSTDPKCTVDVMAPNSLNFETPVLKIQPSSIDPTAASFFIDEMAENSSRTTRAMAACKENDCRLMLYLQDMETGTVMVADWTGRQENRPIVNLIWIGDNLLAFDQPYSPASSLIAVIDVKEHEFKLGWVYFSQCAE